MAEPRRTLLLSVREKFAQRIFSGQKRVELRRVCPRVNKGDLLLVYVPSPIKALVGACTITGLMHDDPFSLWKKVKNFAGVSRDEFFRYYADSQNAYGILIGKTEKLDSEIGLQMLRENFKDFYPPQSYQYLDHARTTAILSLSSH